jgi:hypothetical protein
MACSGTALPFIWKVEFRSLYWTGSLKTVARELGRCVGCAGGQMGEGGTEREAIIHISMDKGIK